MRRMMMGVAAVVLLEACGGLSSDVEGDADASLDSTAFDGGYDSASEAEASQVDSAASDAGSESTTGAADTGAADSAPGDSSDGCGMTGQGCCDGGMCVGPLRCCAPGIATCENDSGGPYMGADGFCIDLNIQ
jgi:hypothetical protein